MEIDSGQAEEPVEELRHRQKIIGKEICKYFQASVTAEVPPQLRALLRQLDASAANGMAIDNTGAHGP